MKFSTQEEYGLRCLIQIAKRGSDSSLTIQEIGKLEGLTTPHVAKLLMVLRKSGFITSTRGQAGGYTIARPPKEIVVGDVLEALGGKLYDQDFCNRHVGTYDVCSHSVDCAVRSLWENVQSAIDSVVDKITLADLMRASNVEFFTTPPPRERVSS
ncbi:MAG TPA: Rrf2 family transcriptional regulator [Fimbriimonadaceae bacterium]|nr:Rrf2 family transcriptional regulator [Fimbriimonadaceae bacterium]